MEELHNIYPRTAWFVSFWKFLHSISLWIKTDGTIPEHEIETFIRNLQFCTYCQECRTSYNEFIDKNPISKWMGIPQGIFYWTVDLHNAINLKLGKPIYSYDDARNEYGIIQV